MKKIILFFILFFLISPPLYSASLLDRIEDTSPTSDDMMYCVNSPASSPTDRKCTVGNVVKGMTVTNMVSGCTDAQVLGGTLAGTGVECQADIDTTCDGGSCSIANSGTLDGYEASALLDNTDAQDLSLTGNTLSLTGDGTSVDLSGYLDNTDTQLTEEEVEDFVGGMVTGNTETLISVTYEDSDGTLDFVVDNDLSNYSNTTSAFIKATDVPAAETDAAHDTCAEITGCVEGAITAVASDSTWTTHDSYPAACSAGSGVSAIGDTLTCVDWEEEIHASEHLADAADEIMVEGLGTTCALNEIVKSDGDGTVSCQADATGAGGSAITFDIGDDSGNDSTDVNEIATTGDTNSIFSESAADKILIAVGNNWPTADAVTNATLTTALTVNTGTVGIIGNVANNSVLTLGAGASSVSGSNTGDDSGTDDQTLAEVLASGADANDIAITSLDKLEGVDNAVYVDLGNDTYVNIAADAYVDLSTPDVKVQDNLQLDSDGAIIEFGADQDVTITHVADTGIQMELDDKLMFGDTAVYIHSNDDGYLDLVADTGVRVSGATTVTGVVTADGVTLGQDENITLGAQTLDHNGTDFVFNDTVSVASGGTSGIAFGTGATSDPCGTFAEGTLFWNTTSNYLCVCDGSNDVQVSDGTTACF